MVVAIIGLLAAMVLPALGRAQAKAYGVSCLNDLKQLQMGWQMYVDDHGGKLPENYADLSTGVWRSSSNSWAGSSSARFDPDDSAIRQGSLFRLGYVQSAGTFVCPGDDATVSSRNGKSTSLPWSLSYAMNGNFGGRGQEAQPVFCPARMAWGGVPGWVCRWRFIPSR